MEIFAEFVYYVFDSLLIPLIRSNFYVTESNVHRSRLFFFRHDVWRYIAEPAMTQIKSRMFEEVKVKDALKILESRQLGYSQIRLLPKQAAVRPIMNLRRRMIVRKDKNVLGRSINSILSPVYNMLKLEKVSGRRFWGESTLGGFSSRATLLLSSLIWVIAKLNI